MDAETRRLRDVAGDAIEPDMEIYGSCMYRSAETGKLYEFVKSEDGEVEQWELSTTVRGGWSANGCAPSSVESQLEGCVADDELGRLYVGEEESGIWRYGAEPGDGDSGQPDRRGVVRRVRWWPTSRGSRSPYGQDGTGYLVASSQGDNSYVVYERGGENGFVGRFRIADGDGIDGDEDTDGIDVAHRRLGPTFPTGVFVAQDGGERRGQPELQAGAAGPDPPGLSLFRFAVAAEMPSLGPERAAQCAHCSSMIVLASAIRPSSIMSSASSKGSSTTSMSSPSSASPPRAPSRSAAAVGRGEEVQPLGHRARAHEDVEDVLDLADGDPELLLDLAADGVLGDVVVEQARRRSRAACRRGGR